GGRAGLLFSGGVDSTAAALLLPGEVPLLFLDRLPGSAQGLPPDPDLDLSWQRLQLDRMAAGTGRGHRVVDGHEGLFRPYPVWHHEMSRLAALYLADSLGLTGVDTGDVLCVRHFGGYCYGQAEGWSFHGAAGTPDPGAAGGRPAAAGDPAGHLLAAGVLGLTAWNSLAGLSSVASNRVVHHSRFRGHTASCYHVHPASSFCFRCDKCFLRLLLHHVEDGWEVPGTLFEHFLGQPRLRDLFRGPFFDWHHVWTYVFQRLRCAHPLSLALQAQAQRGPDLGLLERWYPLAAGLIPPACRDAVTRRIEQTVGVMTPGEIRVLETLSVPPLAAPPLVRDAMPPGEPPLAARLRALLRPAAGPAAPLGNLEAGSIRWAQDAPVVELHLVRRGAVGEDQPLLVLRVEVGTGDRPCWLRAGELAISHARETPPDTREKVQAAEALVRLLAGTGSP
ncbi:MAG: hypothetical protein FJ098_10325, partial [Deltaproteobacteria bacterium]|nr:hypothetical protein [Deltaproteobacteria bacterium]